MNFERSLIETESMEREAVLSQLEHYHQARRKYLMEATTLASSRPNLSLPRSTTNPSFNVNGTCHKPVTSCSLNQCGITQTNHSPPAPGISLVLPPLPQICKNKDQDCIGPRQPEPCCEKAFPVSSSTFNDTSRKNRKLAKTSATSTSDLGNLPPTVR